MKRSGIARGTTRMRRGRMKPVNRERKAKRRERDFGPLADYVRGLDCCACGAPEPSDPAHVKSRGAGGHAWNDDGGPNLLPLCRLCHSYQHSHGWTALMLRSPEEGVLHGACSPHDAAIEACAGFTGDRPDQTAPDW